MIGLHVLMRHSIINRSQFFAVMSILYSVTLIKDPESPDADKC